MKQFLIKFLFILNFISIGLPSCKQENILQEEQEIAISRADLKTFKNGFKNDFSKWVTALDNTIKANGYENFRSIENGPIFQEELKKNMRLASPVSGGQKFHQVQITNISPKVKEYISEIETVTTEVIKQFQFEEIDNFNLEQMAEGITSTLIAEINKIEQEAETNTTLNEVELLSVVAITIAIKEAAPVIVSTGIQIAKTFLNQNIDLNSVELRGWFSNLINTVVNITVSVVVATANFVAGVVTQAYTLGYNILAGNGLSAVGNSFAGLLFEPLLFALDLGSIFTGGYGCYLSPDLWNC